MERKETIISTARKHFSRFGYSKTTMEEIARECKITKPTLYNYFPGKMELFKAVIDGEQTACYNMINTKVTNLARASDKLSTYAEMQIQSLKKFLLLGELNRQAFLDLHPDVVKVYEIYRKKEEDLLQRWIEDGIRNNEFSKVDVCHAAKVFYITIASLKFDSLALHNNDSDTFGDEDRLIESLKKNIKMFVDLFLHGLKRRTN